MNQNWERGQQQEPFNDLVSAIHQMLFTQEQSQLANVTMPEFQRNGPLEKDKLSSDPYIVSNQELTLKNQKIKYSDGSILNFNGTTMVLYRFLGYHFLHTQGHHLWHLITITFNCKSPLNHKNAW